jgi:hypothetical protein
LSISAQTILSNIVVYDKTATLLAWQLGNVYLLLGLLGTFILNTTTELSVVNAYLFALWLGDIGHLGFTLYAMGWEGTLGVETWTATTWGSIGITLFLFAARSIYFLGFFGSESPLATIKVKKATKATERKLRKH